MSFGAAPGLYSGAFMLLNGLFSMTDFTGKGCKTGQKSSAVQPTKEVQGLLLLQALFYPI
jgi:hypothetical protein